MTSVVVVGDVMLDVVVRPLSEIAPTSDTPAAVRLSRGGAAANMAVALRRAWPGAGLNVTYVGCVGDDAAGLLVEDDLRRAGVTPRLQRVNGPTGTVVAIVDATGQRAMLTDRGVNAQLTLAHVAGPGNDELDHLHISGYTVLDAATRSWVPALVTDAQRRGARVSVDVCSVGPLATVTPDLFLACIAGADLLIANEEEALVLSGQSDVDAALEFLTGLFRDVLITRGARGAVVSNDGVVTRVAAPAREVMDTTGAGDATLGTYLARRLAGEDVTTALRAAMEAGADAVGRLGAS